MTMEQFLDYLDAREREAESPTTTSKAPRHLRRTAQRKVQSQAPKRFPSEAFGSRSKAQSPPQRTTSTASTGTSSAPMATTAAGPAGPPDSDPPQGTSTAATEEVPETPPPVASEEVPETPAFGDVEATVGPTGDCHDAVQDLL